MLLVACLNPGILSLGYLVVPLGLLLEAVWRCKPARFPPKLARGLFVYAAVHLCLLLAWQFPSLQHAVTLPGCLGLPLFVDSAAYYMRNSDMLEVSYTDQDWLTWAHAVLLAPLCYVLGHAFRHPHTPTAARSQALRRRVHMHTAGSHAVNEGTPLMQSNTHQGPDSMETTAVPVSAPHPLTRSITVASDDPRGGTVRPSRWLAKIKALLVQFSHLPAVFAMLLWAILFPSWFGLLLLLAASYLLLRPMSDTMRSLPGFVFYILLLVVLDFVTDIDGVVAAKDLSEQFDFGNRAHSTNVWHVICKVFTFFVCLFVCLCISLAHMNLLTVADRLLCLASCLRPPLHELGF
jgi:hypothetical protein